MIEKTKSVSGQNGKTHEQHNFQVENVSEFVQAVCTIGRHIFRNGVDKNEIMLFRGHADKDYEILPSLGRERKSDYAMTIFNEERNMIEMAKYKMPNVFRHDMQPLELLALLQHYGIPTRLLDVTENALVALYFACCSQPDKDGEVIVFKHNERHVAAFPIINAIADTYRLIGTDNSTYSLKWFLEEALNQPYFQEQKHWTLTILANEELRKGWIIGNCSKPTFVYAPIHSMRQQLQRGRYLLFPNRLRIEDEREVFKAIIDPVSKDDEYIIGSIKIESHKKQAFMAELQYFGISSETLFSDSIDSVCQGIVKDAHDKNRGRAWIDNTPRSIWRIDNTMEPEVMKAVSKKEE